MRKGFLSGWGKVFRFSLSRTVSGKGWKLLTLIPALLLLLCIPALVILLQERNPQGTLREILRQAVLEATAVSLPQNQAKLLLKNKGCLKSRQPLFFSAVLSQCSCLTFCHRFSDFRDTKS